MKCQTVRGSRCSKWASGPFSRVRKGFSVSKTSVCLNSADELAKFTGEISRPAIRNEWLWCHQNGVGRMVRRLAGTRSRRAIWQMIYLNFMLRASKGDDSESFYDKSTLESSRSGIPREPDPHHHPKMVTYRRLNL